MNTIKYLALSYLLLFGAFTSIAQQTLLDSLNQDVKKIKEEIGIGKKLKITGHIISQFQIAEQTGIKSFNGGNFEANTDKRFMIREARVKFNYTGKLTELVFQFEGTEKGFAIKDLYAKVSEPWLKAFSLTAGIMNRPFGYEIGIASTMRESPERGRMSQTILNGERDLGAMLTVQLPDKLNFLKLEAGLYNGTGSANVDFDKKKDFISHLSFKKNFGKSDFINLSGGVSYYNGGWRQGTKYVWSNAMISDSIHGFMCDSTSANVGKIAKREYLGGDIQLTINWIIGTTNIRGEYIQGTQSGVSNSSTSPIVLPVDDSKKLMDTYVRNFNGAYFYFIQNILKTKHQLIVKYDWYDPNSKVNGNQIGAAGSNLSSTDIKYSDLGFGWAYKWDDNLKFTVYYDLVKNETTLLKGFTGDIKDNVYSVRMQYKF